MIFLRCTGRARESGAVRFTFKSESDVIVLPPFFTIVVRVPRLYDAYEVGKVYAFGPVTP